VPLGPGQHLLDHQCIHVHQAHLKQVQREHQDLLVLQPIASELPALAVQDEVVGAVPCSQP
jgi:hypothetical protein